eukprot:CAMPEP_0178423038 /NCGR_PEP_ID=MMETSP0689_2-20121128/27485_1 /TAXON_ID=160604 /ORGANISM="Amphidinium massartii, Strain CS-259" /LENGTH=188 /DNA_ID=CAMNT_0020044625 /DNA_START=14 /DNA_END=580 /DNA_ORIENTATION=-
MVAMRSRIAVLLLATSLALCCYLVWKPVGLPRDKEASEASLTSAAGLRGPAAHHHEGLQHGQRTRGLQLKRMMPANQAPIQTATAQMRPPLRRSGAQDPLPSASSPPQRTSLSADMACFAMVAMLCGVVVALAVLVIESRPDTPTLPYYRSQATAASWVRWQSSALKPANARGHGLTADVRSRRRGMF